jgi:CheY-like chemotaxis protein
MGPMTKTVVIAANDPNVHYLLRRYAEEGGFQTANAYQGKDWLALLAQQATSPHHPGCRIHGSHGRTIH